MGTCVIFLGSGYGWNNIEEDIKVGYCNLLYILSDI